MLAPTQSRRHRAATHLLLDGEASLALQVAFQKRDVLPDGETGRHCRAVRQLEVHSYVFSLDGRLLGLLERLGTVCPLDLDLSTAAKQAQRTSQLPHETLELPEKQVIIFKRTQQLPLQSKVSCT